ncbi:MAG: DUF1330 domain-containing protein, partial [Lysobacterales bacterium]
YWTPIMANNVDPQREQFEQFKALPRDAPVSMLNLIRLHANAEYADGRAATGLQAYASYGKESGPVFRKVGGEIIWRGNPQVTLIGPLDEAWDIAFIARYPTAGAFLAMVTDEDYRKAVIHRQAAVADSRLVRTADMSSGEGF